MGKNIRFSEQNLPGCDEQVIRCYKLPESDDFMVQLNNREYSAMLEDHDRLIRIESALTAFKATNETQHSENKEAMEKMASKVEELQKSHGARISSLEDTRTRGMGILAVIGVAWPIIWNKISKGLGW